MAEKLWVEKGITKLRSLLGKEEITFLHPAIGPGQFKPVMEETLKQNIPLSSCPELASLIGAAYRSLDDPHAASIKTLIEKRGLWGNTQSLYIPSKGVYFYENPNLLEESQLITALESNDSRVRFVSGSGKTGLIPSSEIAKHPHIIGAFGEEGAENLAEASDKYHGNPEVWLMDINKMITPKRLYNLIGGSFLAQHRLEIRLNSAGVEHNAYGFGVIEK